MYIYWQLYTTAHVIIFIEPALYKSLNYYYYYSLPLHHNEFYAINNSNLENKSQQFLQSNTVTSCREWTWLWQLALPCLWLFKQYN
jgi:hypothetical protein